MAAPALTATLDRLSRLGDGYELPVRAAGDDWVHAEALVAGQEFDEVFCRHADATGPGRDRAIGSQLLENYLRFVWPAVAAFAIERRVPDVAAANLLVRLRDGWPAEFGLVEPRFAVLTGDPAASEADFVAPDTAALVAWLCERAVDRNAGPLLERIQARFQTSPSALWGNVAAAFVHPLLWRLQLVADDPPAVIRDAEALLDMPAAGALRERIRLLRVVHDSAEWTVSSRRTCCLSWSLPGGANCADCPLLREPEAGAFLRSKLTEAIARTEALRGTFRRRPREVAIPA